MAGDISHPPFPFLSNENCTRHRFGSECLAGGCDGSRHRCKPDGAQLYCPLVARLTVQSRPILHEGPSSVQASTVPQTMKGTYSTTATPIGTAVPFVTDAPAPSAAVGQPYPGFIVVKNHAAAYNPVDKYIAAEFLAGEVTPVIHRFPHPSHLYCRDSRSIYVELSRHHCVLLACTEPLGSSTF
jgi:hypothetical protein